MDSIQSEHPDADYDLPQMWVDSARSGARMQACAP